MEDFGQCSVSTISNGHATVLCFIHKTAWGQDHAYLRDFMYYYELKRDGKTVYKSDNEFTSVDDALTNAEDTVFAGDFKDVRE